MPCRPRGLGPVHRLVGPTDGAPVQVRQELVAGHMAEDVVAFLKSPRSMSRVVAALDHGPAKDFGAAGDLRGAVATLRRHARGCDTAPVKIPLTIASLVVSACSPRDEAPPSAAMPT